MKTKIILTSMVLLAGLSVLGQTNTNLFKEGTILVYEVVANGEEYLFIGRITKQDKDGISFKFLMSEKYTQGNVIMSKKAIKSATELLNYFQSKDYELTDKTSGWLSFDVFKKLKNGEKVDINTGEEESFSLDVERNTFKYPVLIDNRYGNTGSLTAFRIFNTENDHEMIINDNKEYPVIITMYLGWSIRLVAIL